MARFTKIEKLGELIKDTIDGEVVEQTVTSLLPPGENYGSVMYKVDFKVKNGEKEEEYHAVAKCTPTNPVTQKMFNTQVTFKSEIAWYTTVIPTLKQFQKENGVEQVADFFQKFYGARISLDPKSEVVDLNGVILTQNLKTLGYDNVDRHIGFDLKSTKAILRDLASFHSIPLALKLKNKTLFDKNIRPYLPNITFEEDVDRKDRKNPFEDMINALGEIPEIAQYKDRAKDNVMKNKPFQSDTITKEPWGSVSHNDFWMNNIMIKDDEQDPKVMILDLQCPFYGSIVVDLIFFLSTSVALDAIRENLDYFIQFYWDEFIKNLKMLNVDTTLFPYKEFLNELNEAASNGQFGHSLFHIFIINQDKGYTSFDSSDENFKMENFENTKLVLNDRHKEKYKWLVSEYAKRKWI